jgi:hypothetical protein
MGPFGASVGNRLHEYLASWRRQRQGVRAFAAPGSGVALLDGTTVREWQSVSSLTTAPRDRHSQTEPDHGPESASPTTSITERRIDTRRPRLVVLEGVHGVGRDDCGFPMAADRGNLRSCVL